MTVTPESPGVRARTERLAGTSDGASRTRTGDLLGAMRQGFIVGSEGQHYSSNHGRFEVELDGSGAAARVLMYPFGTRAGAFSNAARASVASARSRPRFPFPECVIDLVLGIIHSLAGDGPGWAVFRQGVRPRQGTFEPRHRLPSFSGRCPGRPAGRGP